MRRDATRSHRSGGVATLIAENLSDRAVLSGTGRRELVYPAADTETHRFD